MAQVPRCLINGNVVVNIGCVLPGNSPFTSSGDGFQGSNNGPSSTGLTQGESNHPKTNGNVGGISRRNGPLQRGTSPAMPADVPVQPASSVATQRCTCCGRGTTSNRNSDSATRNADEVKDTFLDILLEELKKITLEDSIIRNVMDVAHSVLTGLNFAGYSNSLIGSMSAMMSTAMTSIMQKFKETNWYHTLEAAMKKLVTEAVTASGAAALNYFFK